MKLNAAQILWLIATAALLGTVVADIVGIAQVPPAYWMFGFGALAIVGW